MCPRAAAEQVTAPDGDELRSFPWLIAAVAAGEFERSAAEGIAVAAARDDWKTTPLPAERTSISLDRTHTAAEFARIREGNVPQEMEDKWFAFYEEPWLHVHRSWTGFEIYEVRFELAESGVRVAEVLVSRDTKQYTGANVTADALLLAALLDGYAGRDDEPAWEQYRASQREG